MKKLILFLLSILITMSFAVAQEEEDGLFISKKYKCSMQGEPSWTMDTTEIGKLVVFNNIDGASTISLRAFSSSEVVPTVNGLADKMANSAYDGWVKLGGRRGTDNDIFITGADDKYEAVYKKTTLGEDGKKTTTIVAESYFTHGNNAFIVTSTTTKYLFSKVKGDIRKIMKSFYIDESL